MEQLHTLLPYRIWEVPNLYKNPQAGPLSDWQPHLPAMSQKADSTYNRYNARVWASFTKMKLTCLFTTG